MSELNLITHSALVSRRERDPRAPGFYLQLSPEGPPRWTSDPGAATAFASMREATRAAARLPANLCAYGMPREVELSAAGHTVN